MDIFVEQLQDVNGFHYFFVVYPSLDASDDESYDNESTKKKSGRVGRTKLDSGDESWNPRARVGPVGLKRDRPIREGAKRPAVERVLEAAAQRRALEPVCGNRFVFTKSGSKKKRRFFSLRNEPMFDGVNQGRLLVRIHNRKLDLLALQYNHPPLRWNFQQ